MALAGRAETSAEVVRPVPRPRGHRGARGRQRHDPDREQEVRDRQPDAGWRRSHATGVSAPRRHEGFGCRSCAGTGYRGRIALHEVMPVSEAVEQLTVGRASANEIRRVAYAEGMRDLRIDGLAKAAEGQTSIQEVLRVAV